MDGNGKDGVDVAQHCFEMLRILLEAHLCQDQRLADVWNGKVQQGGEEGVREASLLGRCWRHLLPQTQTGSPSCLDTLMGSPLQKAPPPLHAVYILSSTQL